MASPDLTEIVSVYLRFAPAALFEHLQRQAGRRTRRGIYSLQVVVWLMMVQRLHPKGTLSTAVQWLRAGAADAIAPRCKRVREDRISAATGGYCQARQKACKLVVRQVNEEIVQRLRNELSAPWPGLDGPVFVIDGSSLELAHTRELVRSVPPAQNQHGSAHWPILRIVVMHELGSGMAESPCWGPMYGAQAVSEQSLARRAIEQLPAHSVVLGDRNFGVFSMAYASRQRQHRFVLRLTQARAEKLFGGAIQQAGDYAREWKASRWDGGKSRTWPSSAAVAGRLIAWRIGRGKSKSWLYLFTDVELPAEQVVELYGRRWTIETDLRSLKRTVHLQQITSKTMEMLEKELAIAISAYNLVRAVMCLAARSAGVTTRQLSFSFALDVLNAAWPRLVAATSRQEHSRQFQRVIDDVARRKLPNRRKRRSYPRAVWRHRSAFPARKQRP